MAKSSRARKATEDVNQNSYLPWITDQIGRPLPQGNA
jgi:hypothetical protein